MEEVEGSNPSSSTVAEATIGLLRRVVTPVIRMGLASSILVGHRSWEKRSINRKAA